MCIADVFEMCCLQWVHLFETGCFYCRLPASLGVADLLLHADGLTKKAVYTFKVQAAICHAFNSTRNRWTNKCYCFANNTKKTELLRIYVKNMYSGTFRK